jgi:hypothetical protein
MIAAACKPRDMASKLKHGFIVLRVTSTPCLVGVASGGGGADTDAQAQTKLEWLHISYHHGSPKRSTFQLLAPTELLPEHAGNIVLRGTGEYATLFMACSRYVAVGGVSIDVQFHEIYESLRPLVAVDARLAEVRACGAPVGFSCSVKAGRAPRVATRDPFGAELDAMDSASSSNAEDDDDVGGPPRFLLVAGPPAQVGYEA